MEDLIIQKLEDIIQVITLQNNKIVEYHEFTNKKNSCVGNIYYGIVKRVLPKLNTLFVDIGLSKPAYLELKTLDKKYKSGDEIIVKVKKDESSKKGAKLTNKLAPNDSFDFVRFGDSPILLYDANSLKNRVMKEFISQYTEYIYTNIEGLKESLKFEVPSNVKITFDDTNFLDDFGLLTEYENISKKKIWLKYGGNIVIEKTEALTTIDVNSAKSIGKKGQDREKIVFETNKDAAEEILMQLRLKDITGMIIIDFINLKKEEERNKIEDILREGNQFDRKRIRVYGFTKLGLCELVRSV